MNAKKIRDSKRMVQLLNLMKEYDISENVRQNLSSPGISTNSVLLRLFCVSCNSSFSLSSNLIPIFFELFCLEIIPPVLHHR